jgi:hypothetical protein
MSNAIKDKSRSISRFSIHQASPSLFHSSGMAIEAHPLQTKADWRKSLGSSNEANIDDRSSEMEKSLCIGLERPTGTLNDRRVLKGEVPECKKKTSVFAPVSAMLQFMTRQLRKTHWCVCPS